MNILTHLPNIISISRACLALPFVYFFMAKQYNYALIIFIGAIFSDMLDGFMARMLNAESKLGAAIDPIADKILTTSAFTLLYFSNQLNVYSFSLILFRDLCIILGVVYMLNYSIKFSIMPVFVSKINTFVQSIYICAAVWHLLNPVSLIIINSIHFVLILTTIISFFEYIVLFKRHNYV